MDRRGDRLQARRDGAKTVILGRDHEALNRVADQITAKQGSCLVKICDLENEDGIKNVAREIESETGPAQILVNCAGVGLQGRALLDCNAADWERIINTNLRGVFYNIQAFAPAVVEARSGHIINIFSIAGKNPLAGGATYAASKWGLNGLTYSLAEELRAHNVRVSVVCPGSVNTEFSTHAGSDLSRMLIPADVAHAVAMLVKHTHTHQPSDLNRLSARSFCVPHRNPDRAVLPGLGCEPNTAALDLFRSHDIDIALLLRRDLRFGRMQKLKAA